MGLAQQCMRNIHSCDVKSRFFQSKCLSACATSDYKYSTFFGGKLIYNSFFPFAKTFFHALDIFVYCLIT